jgi:hypothetical protein
MLKQFSLKRLNDLIKKRNEQDDIILKTGPSVAKIDNIYMKWDGKPCSLDTSFSWQDIMTALKDILDHEEEESSQAVQRNNVMSHILAAHSITSEIIEEKGKRKAVNYI